MPPPVVMRDRPGSLVAPAAQALAARRSCPRSGSGTTPAMPSLSPLRIRKAADVRPVPDTGIGSLNCTARGRPLQLRTAWREGMPTPSPSPSPLATPRGAAWREVREARTSAEEMLRTWQRSPHGQADAMPPAASPSSSRVPMVARSVSPGSACRRFTRSVLYSKGLPDTAAFHVREGAEVAPSCADAAPLSSTRSVSPGAACRRFSFRLARTLPDPAAAAPRQQRCPLHLARQSSAPDVPCRMEAPVAATVVPPDLGLLGASSWGARRPPSASPRPAYRNLRERHAQTSAPALVAEAARHPPSSSPRSGAPECVVNSSAAEVPKPLSRNPWHAIGCSPLDLGGKRPAASPWRTRDGRPIASPRPRGFVPAVPPAGLSKVCVSPLPLQPDLQSLMDNAGELCNCEEDGEVVPSIFWRPVGHPSAVAATVLTGEENGVQEQVSLTASEAVSPRLTETTSYVLAAPCASFLQALPEVTPPSSFAPELTFKRQQNAPTDS